MCAQLVDSEDAGAGVGAGAEAGYAFVPDLMAGLEHTYSPPSFGLRRGMFFPALLAEPARFLAPRPTTRAWLEAQRSRGRRPLPRNQLTRRLQRVRHAGARPTPRAVRPAPVHRGGL